MSLLFSWYAVNFGSYNKTYGSLGAIIGFMFWIWLSIIVVLIGGELNAEAEHQTVRHHHGEADADGRAWCDHGRHDWSKTGLSAFTGGQKLASCLRPLIQDSQNRCFA